MMGRVVIIYGLSSAKTMDKQELFMMKAAHTGEIKFHIMSLEESDETNAEGLKALLENCIMTLGLLIKRKYREVITHLMH